MTVSTTMRWPSIARTPRAPLHASVARAIFERAVRMVPVQVSTPDGILNPESPRPGAPEFRIVRPSAFFARLGRDTKVGFGESYMAGDWRAGEGTDLADLLTPFAARLTTLVPQPLQRLRAVVDKRIPQHHENTLEGSRDNIAAHYDLSNDLFQAFLDPTLSYSSAWFDDDADLTTARDLEGAQLRKIDGILDYAAVRAGTRVLEIGTGWGALAIRAAQRGARVTTVTLSQEQLDLAASRVEEAGVGHLVDLRLQDYREVEGGVRRGRQRGDGRGCRRGVLADLLRDPRPTAGTRRQGRPAVDHDGPQPDARNAALVRLDPEVHLPRWPHPLARGH